MGNQSLWVSRVLISLCRHFKIVEDCDIYPVWCWLLSVIEYSQWGFKGEFTLKRNSAASVVLFDFYVSAEMQKVNFLFTLHSFQCVGTSAVKLQNFYLSPKKKKSHIIFQWYEGELMMMVTYIVCYEYYLSRDFTSSVTDCLCSVARL